MSALVTSSSGTKKAIQNRIFFIEKLVSYSSILISKIFHAFKIEIVLFYEEKICIESTTQKRKHPLYCKSQFLEGCDSKEISFLITSA